MLGLRRGLRSLHRSARRLVSGPLKPRVVMLLLLAGSLGGVWVAHARDPIPVRLAWWGVLVLLGVLAGGQYWRLRLFDRAAFESRADAASVLARWRQVERLASVSLAVLAIASVVAGVPPARVSPAWAVFGIAIVSPALFQLSSVIAARDRTAGLDMAARYACFASVLLGLVTLAWLETGSGPVAWLVRVGHLGAVSLWLGGATWHNTVMAPTIQREPALAAPLMGQARRFRRHLPAVILVVFATGAHQTVGLFGASLDSLLTTPLGRLVSGKLLVLAVLAGLVVASLQRARATSDTSPGLAGETDPTDRSNV